MVQSIKHKGVQLLSESGSAKGVDPAHAKRILVRLDRLDAIETVDELPAAWNCHALHGELKGFHAINISAQWRLVFRFEGGDVYDLDYVQYH